MKCVFILVVVGLCVLYMQAPVMNARTVHKRSVDEGGEESEDVQPGNPKEHKHGTKVNKEQPSKPRGESDEEMGELKERIDDLINAETEEENAEADRKRRAATKDSYKKWPTRHICYKFKPNAFTPADLEKLKGMVAEAAKEWNRMAGLDIHEAKDPDASNCISVLQDGGCWSYIGYQASGHNVISLSAPGCFAHGVILHEFGHALGLSHEAKRADRDKYVTVNGENILAEATGEFTKDLREHGISSPTYKRLSEYDYCSIMHYSATAFTGTGKQTIIAKDPKNVDKNFHFTAEDITPCMGSQISLSLRDGEGIAKLYGTLEEDDTEKIAQCQHGGYLLKDDHDKCVCSTLFKGDKCETPVDDEICGKALFNLNSNENQHFGKFKTPKKPNDVNYPLNTKCTWVFTSQAGKQLCVGFPEGYAEEAPSTTGSCAFDWFEIATDELLTNKAQRLCGNSGPYYRALGSQFGAIVFKSDDMQTAPGFEGIVTFIDGSLTGNEAYKKCEEAIVAIHNGKVPDNNQNTVDTNLKTVDTNVNTVDTNVNTVDTNVNTVDNTNQGYYYYYYYH